MAEYVLPEEEKERIKESYSKFLMAQDILKKLRAVGEPNAEAEVRARELATRAKKFADVFDVELEE